MPVHFETTSATSSSVTLLRRSLVGCLLGAARCGEPPLELGDLAVGKLGHAREVLCAACGFQVQACALELLFDVSGALHGGLLGLPDFFEVGVFLFESLDLLVERGATLLRRIVDSFFSASRSIFSWIMRRSSRSMDSGLESISMRMRDAASSIRSMALSGSWRSVM
jgi:hypothetical protein